jgi:hypothetical protein
LLIIIEGAFSHSEKALFLILKYRKDNDIMMKYKAIIIHSTTYGKNLILWNNSLIGLLREGLCMLIEELLMHMG